MPASLKLVIGNRNYSSWSMRGWLAARHSGLAFDEIFIPLSHPETKATLKQHSPSGLVPVLVMDGTVIWDSLAIIEAFNDLAPSAGIWPTDVTVRAVARAVCAEMHAGFYRLRRDMPMDLRASNPKTRHTEDALADAALICARWHECRATYGDGGPYLFGAWSAADMMYAPVVGRFRTYGVPVPNDIAAYIDAVWAHPDVAAWVAGAIDEPYVIDI